MSHTPIDYAGPTKHPSQAWLVCGITASCIAVVATIAPIPSIVEVASYPPGTSMRPMLAVGMRFLGAAAGLIAALPLALVCLIKGRRKRAGVILGVIALVLGLIAVFGDTSLFNYIVASRGYIMEP